MRTLYVFSILILIACGPKKQATEVDSSKLSWEEVAATARGTSVTWMMWQGDPFINSYVADYVIPSVREKYAIELEVVSGQGPTIVQTLLKEMEAGIDESRIDMVWINGETFYQLRQINALYGPFVEQLPNSKYIDFDNPFIKYDFQQPSGGFEMPWGNVQMTLIYDTAKVQSPPLSLVELKAFVAENPGRFTIPTEFTGMTFLKALLYELAPSPQALHGAFNEDLYDSLSGQLWNEINAMKKNFWKQGTTFPSSLAAMHQMFASGEVLITMSNNDTEVDNKITRGLFPASAQAYVWETGTIQNSHFIGIPALAANKAGAMVVANFLIDPEAQLEKFKTDTWGDGTVLDLQKLPDSVASRFQAAQSGRNAPPRSQLNEKALMEPAPEYMIRLFEDFRKEVIEK
jgi:putative spermidine/putrescine transport system substrate-binding protein